jgi:hypothetical protein
MLASVSVPRHPDGGLGPVQSVQLFWTQRGVAPRGQKHFARAIEAVSAVKRPCSCTLMVAPSHPHDPVQSSPLGIGMQSKSWVHDVS